MTTADKTSLVKELALRIGFDTVGIASVGPIPRAVYYRRWLAAGHAASMTYLQKNVSVRENPAGLLDGACSAICVALGYRRDDDQPAAATAPANAGHIAQYARGTDYHRVMKGMLTNLVAEIRQKVNEEFGSRVFVDTGPILERELAAAAGLGWIGKNTLVLNRRLGSYFFLGEVITTLELEIDRPEADHCGTCTRCLDACPSGAFPEPRVLDASRCISYLTIEHRGDVPAQLHSAHGDWVFGCDICQQVCPYNQAAPLAKHPDIAADVVPARIPLIELLTLRSGAYRRLVKHAAIGRARRNMLRRNAAIALGNAARLSPEEREALSTASEDSDPGVRQAATSALKRR